MPIEYQIKVNCPETAARRGCLATPHGEIQTPAFMPVGTQGPVKAITAQELRELEFPIMVAIVTIFICDPVGIIAVQVACTGS